MLVQTSYVVTSSLAFARPWYLCGRMSEGMILLLFYISTSCCAMLSSPTSPVISPLFLMKKWQVCVISLGMCPATVKQLFKCTAMAYSLCLLSSLQNVSNGSPMQGLHNYGLYTWFTFVFLQLVVLCTESVRCLDNRHWSHLLLVTLDRPWRTHML